MINASTITEQIQNWLETHSDFANYVVTRSDFLNEDPGRATNGWIGIYRRSLNYDPRNLGVPPNNYEADFDFMVIVQKTSILSGADCEDKLEESVKLVLDRIVQIPKTYIAHFSDISIEYTYLETERTSLYFQGALILFTAELFVEVE